MDVITRIEDSEIKEIVDLGCGNGAMVLFSADRFRKVTAIDIDSEILQVARSRIRKGNVEWLKYNLNLPLPRIFRGRFDVAIALEIIEHMDSPENFLETVRSCLKQQGTLILSTPNLASLEAFAGGIWAWRSGRKYTAWDSSHKNLFTSKGILSLLRKSGFSPYRIIGYHYDVDVLPMMKVGFNFPVVKTSRFPLNRVGFNIIVESHCT
jgi:2-polyprenyl-3-methyl-5-hydroxy-6-metoxy-1,4-benzoquinol methylase